MPTKKKRVNIIPDNMPAVTTPEETCPSLYTGQKLAENDPEKYGRIVQALGEGKPMTRIAKSERVSPETISAIAKRENKSVEAVQALTAGLTSGVAMARGEADSIVRSGECYSARAAGLSDADYFYLTGFDLLRDERFRYAARTAITAEFGSGGARPFHRGASG